MLLESCISLKVYIISLENSLIIPGFSNEEKQIIQGHNLWLCCIFSQSSNSIALFVLHGQELNIYPHAVPCRMQILISNSLPP